MVNESAVVVFDDERMIANGGVRLPELHAGRLVETLPPPAAPRQTVFELTEAGHQSIASIETMREFLGATELGCWVWVWLKCCTAVVDTRHRRQHYAISAGEETLPKG